MFQIVHDGEIKENFFSAMLYFSALPRVSLWFPVTWDWGEVVYSLLDWWDVHCIAIWMQRIINAKLVLQHKADNRRGPGRALVFSRSRLGLHCIPSGCSHDASAPTVVHLLLRHAHPLGSGHTSKMYSRWTLCEETWIPIRQCTSCVSPFLWTVRRHGGRDDVHHRYVSHGDAQAGPAGAFPPPLLPHVLLLSADHGHRGQYLVMYVHVHTEK